MYTDTLEHPSFVARAVAKFLALSSVRLATPAGTEMRVHCMLFWVSPTPGDPSVLQPSAWARLKQHDPAFSENHVNLSILSYS